MSATTTRPTAPPIAHEWRLYEDLSRYEDEDDGIGVQPRAQAVVIHGISQRCALGILRKWLEEGNEGIEIMGARWLVPREKRLGKASSSLIVFTRSTENVVGLRLGRKWFPTTAYDWDRPRG